MKRAILSIIVLLSILTLGESQNNQISVNALIGGLRARQIGPAVMSGRISSLDVVNKQTEIMYVGSASGGVWKSISGGITFRPVFDDYTQSIGKVTIDQNHPDTVWVGTGEPWVRNSVSVGTGIYKTTDGGQNWQHLGLKKTERIADIIIHPTNSDIVYVAALGHLWDGNEERGVYKTIDGGKSWEKILHIDENTGCTDLDIDPENPDIIYAAMWSFRRYPWSFDSGQNGKSGLYKTTDGGKNWNMIHNGLPDEKLGRMAIAVAPSNGELIYLTVECKSKEGKGLYLSLNRGESWEKVSNDFNTTVRPFYFSNLVVDPKNDSIVMKCGLQMIISEDRGDRFRPMSASVHSDVHDIWIDPNNTKHLIIGTDGGVYESFDRGETFRMFMNLPVSQFYHLSVDDDIPFNVYGGLQDNASWFGPSRKAGGINNGDWKSTVGGDGFYAFRHPTDKDIIFGESQGGNLSRYNKKTGRAKNIKPFSQADEDKYRFSWNAPVHLSPNDPDRMYFGAQYVFRSEDKGDSWKRISPDLTTNDPEKQKQHESGGLTIDNSTAENHCTIYAIAESPKDGNLIWAGTDDGNLQLTINGGVSWTNVVENIPDLPKNTWVSFIEPSHFEKGTLYVTFDGHRTGDMQSYLYKTTDLGKTWINLITDQIDGYALSVREDLENPNLLFLGTEFGLFISIDGGKNWARHENNMPKVGVRDMVIHPRDNALVMGTHGRGIIIIDDITPLRQVNEEVLAKKVHFFKTEVSILRDPGAGGGWYGGDGNFSGPNPNTRAKVVYFMNKRHVFGKMYVEVFKDGELVKSIPAGKSAGINIVEMPTSMKKPKAAPSKSRMGLAGSMFGPNIPAGKYDVKLIKGKETFETGFELVYDPESPFTANDRAIQHKTTMKLYNMTERLAYLYHVYDLVEKKTTSNQTDQSDEKLTDQMKEIAEYCKTEKGRIAADEGDFYVDEEEMVHERISELYYQVSSFPGHPSQSQIDRTSILENEVLKLEEKFQLFIDNQLKTINDTFKDAGLEVITISSFEEFLALS